MMIVRNNALNFSMHFQINAIFVVIWELMQYLKSKTKYSQKTLFPL